MNKEEAILFLSNIAKEVKRSFETPVILFTKKDYADPILTALVGIRYALMHRSTPEKIIVTVKKFHVEWLKASEEVDNFKKRLGDIPRESIFKSIEFTKECMAKRQEKFQNFIDTLPDTMTSAEETLLQSDITVISDMRELVNYALAEKQQSLLFLADKEDFYVLVMNEIEELMNWMDKLYDFLAIQISKVLNFKIHLGPKDLTKTLQQIIDEVASYPIPYAETIAHEIASKSHKLSSAIRVSSLNEIEISKIDEKIKHLEDRINRLRAGKSSAIVALQHKAMYLEERLRSLENLKLSLNGLRNQQVLSDKGDINDGEYNIFNHLLPIQDRRKLVDELVKLWENAIIGDHRTESKSIISILSIADYKEVFSDEVGDFSVDKYGRKMYSMKDDDTMYQLNEIDQLVPVGDDEHHIYYYDECGRYYLDKNGIRVYKAHNQASEYMLHTTGSILLKLSENADGKIFYYDHLGRYYLDGDILIYSDPGSEEKYLDDGLGNLVRMRDEWPNYIYDKCPEQPMVLADNLYVKEVVGDALKKCLAQVIMVQPKDPISFLADCLEQYRRNEENRQKLLKEENLLNAAREALTPEEISLEEDLSTIAISHQTKSESDINFMKYVHQTNLSN